MTARASDTTVVIPNYNGDRFLQACLRALELQTCAPTEIIVVDNGSDDHSVDLVRTAFPAVRLIQQGRNTGFAAAVNAGIRASDCALVATLNNDTVVEPGWLQNLATALHADARAGMAASKMLFVEPRGTINSAGICVDRAGIAWDRLGGQPDATAGRESKYVFGACAGAALYRRTMLDEIGIFDQDFFAYLEDVDLAWRAQLAGWRAVYVPEARVTHWHSATAIEGSPFKSRLLGRNKVGLVAKNYPAPHLWAYLPLIAAYDGAAVVYAALARRDLFAARGRLDGLRGLPAALRKRRQVQALRRVSPSALLASMEPVASLPSISRRYAHLRPVARSR